MQNAIKLFNDEDLALANVSQLLLDPEDDELIELFMSVPAELPIDLDASFYDPFLEDIDCEEVCEELPI
jgi:hypothetical protein